MKKLAIGLRLTLWFLGIFLLAEIIVGVGMWLTLRQHLFAIADTALDGQSADLQRFLFARENLPPAQLQAEIAEACKIERSRDYLQISEHNGNLIYRSRLFADHPLPQLSLDDLDRPLYENRKIGPERFRVLSQPMEVSGQVYLVRIGHPMQEEFDALVAFRGYLLWVAPLLLLAASGGAYWVSRRALAVGGVAVFVLTFMVPSMVLAQAVPVVSADVSNISGVAAKYVRSEMGRQHIPGLALLVSRGGKIVQAEGFGQANVELQVPVTPETIFQSGSVGKQFTATGVMMLVEEGKVGLDDPLTKYFPEALATWKEVTVRELLSHTAGFGDYPDKFDFHKDRTEDEELKLVESIPLAFSPGTKWDYSNLGYLTLGVLIHRVTGEFYGDFLQQRIFQPLGMQTTRIISESDIVLNRAAGYRLVNGKLMNQEWVAPSINTTADGSLYFSILDLAKWDAALYTEKLLKRSSLEQMWTPAKLKNGQPNKEGYGFGWFIEERHGHRVLSHDGAWQGFQTTIARYVDDALTVVILTNLADAEPGKIAEHVADLYLSAASDKN